MFSNFQKGQVADDEKRLRADREGAEAVIQQRDVSTLSNGMVSKQRESAMLAGIIFSTLTMAAHLERDNRNFKRKVFFAACGFVETESDVLVPLEEVAANAAKTAKAYRRGEKKRFSEAHPGPNGDEGTG